MKPTVTYFTDEQIRTSHGAALSQRGITVASAPWGQQSLPLLTREDRTLILAVKVEDAAVLPVCVEGAAFRLEQP